MLKKLTSMVLSIVLLCSFTINAFAVETMNTTETSFSHDGVEYTMTTTQLANGGRTVRLRSSAGEDVTSTYYPLGNRLTIASGNEIKTYSLNFSVLSNPSSSSSLPPATTNTEYYEYLGGVDDKFFQSYGYSMIRKFQTTLIEYYALHDGVRDEFIRYNSELRRQWVGYIDDINKTFDLMVGAAVIGTGLADAVIAVGLLVMISGAAPALAAVGAVYGALGGVEAGYVLNLVYDYMSLDEMWKNR